MTANTKAKKTKKPAKKAPVAKKAPTAKKTPAAKKSVSKNPCLNPYIIFNGNCETAFKLYQKVFGGKIDLCRYKDMPPEEGKVDAKHRNKILHSSLPVGEMLLMGADTTPDNPVTVGDNISLSICAPSPAEAKRIFKALSARGKVITPLAKTFWAELYGMAQDRFGICWMVNYSEF